MNFSVHQAAHIAEAAACAKDYLDGLKSDVKFNFEKAQKLIDALNEAISYMERGKQIPNTVQTTINDCRANLRIFRKQPQPNLEKFIKEVEQHLFEAQKKVLVDYKPCLIPPKDLKDPVRVGQASDDSAITKTLEQLRKLPQRKYDEDKKKIAEKQLSKIEEHQGRWPDGEREKKLQELVKFIDKVRAMSDVDFEMNKSELAKEFSKFARKEMLEEKLEKISKEDKIVRDKIRAFLLNPRIVPLLRERIKQLKQANYGKPVDLDKISPAPSCKTGGCAIKEK